MSIIQWGGRHMDIIDQAYQLYEKEQWKLARIVIKREKDFDLNPVALNLMGSIEWKLGKVKEAKKYYLLAIKCYRDFWPAYYNLGNLSYEMGKIDKAIQYYIGALNYKGEHFKLFYNIGTCYLKKKDSKRAIYYFIKALQLKPTYLESNINLAKAYYLRDEYQKSFLYFNTALALDEGNNAAKIGYQKSWEKIISKT